MRVRISLLVLVTVALLAGCSAANAPVETDESPLTITYTTEPVTVVEPVVEPVEDEEDEQVAEIEPAEPAPLTPTLIADFPTRFTDEELDGKIAIDFGEGDFNMLLMPLGNTIHVRICSVNYDDGVYYIEDEILNVYYYFTGYYINYSTATPGEIATEAIIIKDANDNIQEMILTADGYVGGVEIVDVSPWWFETNDDYIDMFLDEFNPIIDGAELIHADNRIYLQYSDGELVELCEPFYLRTFDISPDRTKISFPTPQHGGGDFFYVDIPSRTVTQISEFNRRDLSLAPKRAVWLDDEILLVIAGLDQGSLSVGGNIYYYNITDGSNGKIINMELGVTYPEFVRLAIEGDLLTMAICVHFNVMDPKFTFDDSIPLSQVWELIRDGETYEFPVLDIPNRVISD
ncbi:MAG: DUF4652 domain-containing protein [Oscillospiraceae bacterium]|nr:DUF4652 domain-containing protein [Oscillospiraceae bacterium]